MVQTLTTNTSNFKPTENKVAKVTNPEKAKISDDIDNAIDNYTAHSDRAEEDAPKLPSLVKLDNSLNYYFQTFSKER